MSEGEDECGCREEKDELWGLLCHLLGSKRVLEILAHLNSEGSTCCLVFVGLRSANGYGGLLPSHCKAPGLMEPCYQSIFPANRTLGPNMPLLMALVTNPALVFITRI